VPYPIPTVHRFAYDRDGTIVLFVLIATNATTVLNSTQRRSINGETAVGWGGNDTPAGFRPGSAYVIWLFPVPTTLTHYMIVAANVSTTWQWSTDTTDGINGTWNNVTVTYDDSVPSDYRSPRAFTGQPFASVRGLRASSSWGDGSAFLHAAHVYGTPTSSSPDQLQIWNPSSDVRVTIPDLGSLATGADSVSLPFRVKNVSASIPTTDVVVSADAITDTGTAAGVDFSSDGSTWFSTLNVGDLDPGDISAVTYMRVNGSDLGGIGPKTFRILAVGDI